MLILFPSYLQHSVRMYHGERPRICVAFNAHMGKDLAPLSLYGGGSGEGKRAASIGSSSTEGTATRAIP